MTSQKLSRRNMLKATAASAAAAGMVDGLLDPNSAWAQSDRPLRIRTNRTITSTDPGYMVGGFEMVLQYACLARLAKYINSGDSWDWEPSEFVSSLEQVDPQTISFELKQGIMWYDGTTHEEIGELNAEDVKYSLERMQVSEWKDKAVALDHVEVTGSHSGIIHMNQPFAPIWLTWLCDGTGTIVSKVAVEAAGGKYDGIFNFYCGYYRVSEWVQKQSYTLEPNPNWGGSAPGISDVKFIIIDEEKTAEIAFEAGEVDITGIAIDAIPRLLESPPADSIVKQYSGTQWYWMGMNTDHPNLQDIRVRRAIQHAVDVDTVLEGAWNNVGVRAHGIVPPGLVGYREEGKFMTPDLDAARALIAEAGAEGMTVTLKTINVADRMAAATIIQANLAEIGLNVEVVPLDAGPFWALGLESEGDEWQRLELWIMSYLDSPDPSQMTQWFISDQVGVWNWERWSDPEFDELFAAGLAETDTAKRHDIYVRMQEIMEDTGAYVFLMFPPNGVMYREGLEPVITPNGYIWQVAEFEWNDGSA
ncbi:MAG: peptide ABC transporter substrate-binding protein [Rhodospirillaceae bacterium]|nr:peptide ABC transporter substrate-binding protein [Rhodospirillaceae bacterium]